jgi:hypothetical protein
MNINRRTLLLAFTLSIFNYSVFASEEKPLVAIKDYTWENREKRQYHSVWFEALGEEEPDYFFPEENYEREFKQTGTFPYRCGPHPKMTGTVHVID